jgi:catechol 2,3-dioxygenase-like lactoylglutathione lyase family enzyme
MAIQGFFHLIHIVDDEDEVDAWYDRVFAIDRFAPKGWMELEKRWASLGWIGDCMIEVLEPSKEPDDQHMPLSRFRNRFGQHFHSLAWYADDIKGLFDDIRSHGYRIAKPGGGMFPDGDIDPGPTIFTHPKDTYGQLEFVLARDGERRTADGRAITWWSDEHPLGIERVSHFTTIVSDLDGADEVYVDAIGGKPIHSTTTPEVDSHFVFIGTETVVELAKPLTTGSRIARDQAVNGDLPHACTFTVVDLERAERHIEACGIRIADRAGTTFTLDPADCYNAVYAFTSESVPGDPRVWTEA